MGRQYVYIYIYMHVMMIQEGVGYVEEGKEGWEEKLARTRTGVCAFVQCVSAYCIVCICASTSFNLQLTAVQSAVAALSTEYQKVMRKFEGKLVQSSARQLFNFTLL